MRLSFSTTPLIFQVLITLNKYPTHSVVMLYLQLNIRNVEKRNLQEIHLRIQPWWCISALHVDAFKSFNVAFEPNFKLT